MESVLALCGGLEAVPVAAGEVLIREGAREGRMYVLAEGAVAVLKGEVRVARIAQAGALFGEMQVLLDLPASATVVAETAARVYVIDRPEAFMTENPGLALHMSRMLAQRLNDATTYLADLKRQFETSGDHLGMVDKILESLMNQQRKDRVTAKPRDDDSRL